MSTAQHRWLMLLATLCLLASLAGVALGEWNRSTQLEVAQRQQYLQQSVQLETLYREMVRSLAELATRSGDTELTAMLQRHGISWTPAAASPAAPSAAAPSAKAGARK